MIIQDAVSRGSFLIVILITVYFALFQTTVNILFPVILLVSALFIEYQYERRGTGFMTTDKPDLTLEKREITSTAYYAVIGIVGILVSGYAASLSQYFSTLALSLTNLDSMLYSVLMAVSEEMFFRGALMDLIWNTTKQPIMAVIISSGIFCAYHIARYGTNYSSLIYVLFGGLVLGFIAYKSQRLGPSIIAHSANNILASIGVSLF